MEKLTEFSLEHISLIWQNQRTMLCATFLQTSCACMRVYLRSRCAWPQVKNIAKHIRWKYSRNAMAHVQTEGPCRDLAQHLLTAHIIANVQNKQLHPRGSLWHFDKKHQSWPRRLLLESLKRSRPCKGRHVFFTPKEHNSFPAPYFPSP